MVIYSVKAQNIKLVLSLFLAAVAVVLVVVLAPSASDDYVYPDEVLPAVHTVKGAAFKNVKTNDDRIALLARFGWEVEAEAREVVEVTIPEEFDAVYNAYNQLQIGEGLDLAGYRGKTVKRYTYVVTNYEYDGTVYANLLIYRDQVIGGDICSAKLDGFVHGLTKENDFLTNEE